MQYLIRGENIEVTPAIRDYVEKKLSRLERYFDREFEAKVNLKVYNNLQKIEVTIPLPYLLLRAEDTQADLYAAVDLVVDKLERQIRKHKTKINRKMREKGTIRTFEPDTNVVLPIDEEEEDVIVRTKTFDLKPMDIEEAILQMNMLGHNFYLFTNAVTNKPNVVYARKDGKYALIETR